MLEQALYTDGYVNEALSDCNKQTAIRVSTFLRMKKPPITDYHTSYSKQTWCIVIDRENPS